MASLKSATEQNKDEPEQLVRSCAMQQFLKDFLEKVDGVVLSDELTGPATEVREGENVMGVLPDELKRLFVVFDKLHVDLSKDCEASHARLKEILAKKRSEISPDDVAFGRQHLTDHCHADIIDSIFWQSVKEAYPDLIGQSGTGIRKGWQVVTYVSDEPRVEVLSMGLIRL